MAWNAQIAQSLPPVPVMVWPQCGRCCCFCPAGTTASAPLPADVANPLAINVGTWTHMWIGFVNASTLWLLPCLLLLLLLLRLLLLPVAHYSVPEPPSTFGQAAMVAAGMWGFRWPGGPLCHLHEMATTAPSVVTSGLGICGHVRSGGGVQWASATLQVP